MSKSEITSGSVHRVAEELYSDPRAHYAYRISNQVDHFEFRGRLQVRDSQPRLIADEAIRDRLYSECTEDRLMSGRQSTSPQNMGNVARATSTRTDNDKIQ